MYANQVTEKYLIWHKDNIITVPVSNKQIEMVLVVNTFLNTEHS